MAHIDAYLNRGIKDVIREFPGIEPVLDRAIGDRHLILAWSETMVYGGKQRGVADFVVSV